MLNEVHYKSGSKEWETPQDLFDALNEKFKFTLDVCATPDNTKCEKYFTKEENGLIQDWSNKVCWMNPPYGKVIKEWVKKAYESSHHGATVVCLLPARTDTSWWHNYCMLAEIVFIPGRLKFSNTKNSAPFPSAIVIFKELFYLAGTSNLPVINTTLLKDFINERRK